MIGLTPKRSGLARLRLTDDTLFLMHASSPLLCILLFCCFALDMRLTVCLSVCLALLLLLLSALSLSLSLLSGCEAA